jgi:hypothetical protein
MVPSVGRVTCDDFSGGWNKCAATSLVTANAVFCCDHDRVAAKFVVELQVASDVRQIAESNFKWYFT